MAPKYILITGTSTGIGYATALLLAQHGFKVIAGIRKLPDGEALIPYGHGNIMPILLDVSQKVAIEAGMQQVAAICGEEGLFAVINNAGINYVAPFEYSEESKYRELMEVNFFGVCNLLQASIPLLKKHASRQPDARIINISSMGGMQGVPWVSYYSASKFALMGLTESIYYELKRFRIKVSLITPGAVKTTNTGKTEHSASLAIQQLSPDDIPHYQPGLELMRSSGKRAEKFASTPEDMARAILRVLHSTNPKFNYPVGTSARIMSVLIRILPTALRQKMMSKQMG